VLIVGAATPATEMVAERLVRAGHELRRCVEPGQSPFPCAGLRCGACPVTSDGGVDVAVVIRIRPHPRPQLTDLGAICALRDGVPLVVSGNHVLSPFDRWASARVDLDDVVAAVERLAHEPPPDRHPQPPHPGPMTPLAAAIGP
jgi:hypothetical protein